jgi:hypothetical protein
LLNNVSEAAETRQEQADKRSSRAVNQHLEPVFNAVGHAGSSSAAAKRIRAWH